MLKLSKKIDYGLVLLSKMVIEREPTSARELAGRFQLPQPMVANILKAMANAGILDSTRGAQGGYQLARDPGEISLAVIVEALEGPFNLVDCVGDQDGCKFTRFCPTHDPIQVMHQKFHAFMEDLTLAEIMSASNKPLTFGSNNEKAHLPG